MELSIAQRKENPLLSRWEVQGTVVFDGPTCSNNPVMELLAKELKVEPEQVVVQQLRTIFGARQARFSALAYTTKEAQQKYSVVYSHLKKKEGEEKKAAPKKK